MHLNAHLDVDVVALQADDTVSLLLELTAPKAPAQADEPHAPRTLQIVLDRSGSMAGGRLETAKAALADVVGQLAPQDNFGLVAFDDEVRVVVPDGPLHDKELVRALVAGIVPGGSTNLSGGLLRGVREARRVAGGGGATVIVLSDGIANVGVTEPEALGRVTQAAREHGVTTHTVGIGLGYDEQVMAAVARGGAGDTHFAEEPDAAASALREGVDGLLDASVQAATLTIRPTGAVAGVRLFNDLPVTPIAGALMVEVGDLYAGETRKLLLAFDVPAMPGLGLATVAEIELAYVELPDLTSHTITLPVQVNVVPGDEAAGRTRDPKVVTEVAFQRAQEAKRRSAQAIRDDDRPLAAAGLASAAAEIRAAAPAAPPAARDELLEEASMLDELSDRARTDVASRVSKHAMADAHRKQQRRGRGSRRSRRPSLTGDARRTPPHRLRPRRRRAPWGARGRDAAGAARARDRARPRARHVDRGDQRGGGGR